jgi:integrase
VRTAEQLRAFLGWARDHSRMHAAWYMLAYTGMRRGETQQRCARALGETAPPTIRVHDLRLTTSLRDRENVKVVSERLGHANVTVTLTTYSHVMPGDQRQAAARFAALVAGAEA